MLIFTFMHPVFRPHPVWSSAVYRQDADAWTPEKLPEEQGRCALLLQPPEISFSRKRLHSVGDPFLYAQDDAMYLFAEEERKFGKGEIACLMTRDGETWKHLGIALKENHHLSYPFVFRHEGETYMLPESAEGGGVDLYVAEDFPLRWKKKYRLLDIPLWDPSLLIYEGRYYLFATHPEKGLLLFHSDELPGGWREHPASPVTNDPRYRRCGGIPFLHHGKWMRLSQDGSEDYGKKLNLHAMETLSATEYAESLFRSDILSHNVGWNSLGGHHLSFATFKGQRYFAVDGKGKGTLANQFLYAFWRIMNGG